jgi:hypothetical protein
MATITFDTLSYAKKLKSAGFTDQQAEVQAEAFAEIIAVVPSCAREGGTKAC